MECYTKQSVALIVDLASRDTATTRKCKLIVLQESLVHSFSSLGALSINKINTYSSVDVVIPDSLQELKGMITEWPFENVQSIGCIGLLQYFIANSTGIQDINTVMMLLVSLKTRGTEIIIGEVAQDLDEKYLMNHTLLNSELKINISFGVLLQKWLYFKLAS